MLRSDSHHRNGRRLAKLYRDHAAAAFGYAHHLTGSREDAEDLVQIAFLEAHRAFERGERIVNPRAWLVTAVKHRAYNLHRDRREAPDADAIDRLADRPADGAATAAAELERVRAVLYGLPEAQHHAFVMRHWSGMSNTEIASVLGTSESAVESLLVRARQAIVSDDALSDVCLDVRRRLSQGDEVGRFHDRHIEGCRSCRVAQQRLARIAGIAAAVALVPRIHVAQALAASVPGFSAAAASGGAGAAAAGAGAKLGAAKTVLAVLSVGAVAAGAGVAHSGLLGGHHGIHHGRVLAPRAAAPAAADAGATAVPVPPASAGTAGPAGTTSSNRDGSSGGSGTDGSAGSGSSSGDTGSGGGPSSGDSSSGGGTLSGGDPQSSDPQSSGDGSGGGSSSPDSSITQGGSGSGGDTTTSSSGDQSGG